MGCCGVPREDQGHQDLDHDAEEDGSERSADGGYSEADHGDQGRFGFLCAGYGVAAALFWCCGRDFPSRTGSALLPRAMARILGPLLLPRFGGLRGPSARCRVASLPHWRPAPPCLPAPGFSCSKPWRHQLGGLGCAFSGETQDDGENEWGNVRSGHDVFRLLLLHEVVAEADGLTGARLLNGYRHCCCQCRRERRREDLRKARVPHYVDAAIRLAGNEDGHRHDSEHCWCYNLAESRSEGMVYERRARERHLHSDLDCGVHATIGCPCSWEI
mmetsp:Transcript_62820/g.134911  ORF Transcript_62820/g.134911 Transcript_62820/m.134911 type:complete len:273 (+) Transcript_62820:367-1185(+)